MNTTAAMRNILILIICLFTKTAISQTPQIWLDFQEDKAAGITPELTDYSFAGYHFSELPIPSADEWQHFDVTDYGAVANDEGYDDTGIQDAINAAQGHPGPAVVYFPVGRYIVSDDNDINKMISVTRDSIVLKGAGSEEGGTEIFMDQRRVNNGHWQFQFEPSNTGSSNLTFLAGAAKRGDHRVIVESSENLEIGMVIRLYHKSQEFAEAHFGDLELSSDWTRLFGSSGGMTLYELHEIQSISGNLVTFVNPIQTDLPELPEKYQVASHAVINEVGIEDILFTSDWVNYPEDFVHHKDDIHDYAWNAVQFANVQNGWVRNCEFRDWNQVMDVRQSIGFTVENVLISGKKGHASFLTRRGYGLLVKDCEDLAGMHHGPGTGYSGVNTVYVRHKMQPDQSFDSHSGQPYATLMDDVQGGVFNKNGGPHESYPHHARYLTFWNFRHEATGNISYDFWSLPRNGNTYAEPFFVGFQSNMTVNFSDEGLNELPGQMVEPRSLFDAQLALRLEEQNTQPAIEILSPSNGDELAVGTKVLVEVKASDPDGAIVSVRLLMNETELREIESPPYTWGEDEGVDPELFDMEAGQYKLKAIATDEDGNESESIIDFTIGQAPTCEIVDPKQGDVVEAGTPLVVSVNAADSDGEIAAVSLYLNDNLVREINTAPYEWGNDEALDPALFDLSSGAHILKVIATDNDDLISMDEVNITANNLPEVSFKFPLDGQVFEYGVDLPVEVEATDEDGEIAEVLLYLNGDFYREEVNPPYTWGYNQDLDEELFGMQAGTYILNSRAVDNLGSVSSTTITVIVEEEPLSARSEIDNNLLIYPNPVQNELHIKSSIEVHEVQIKDLMGRSWVSNVTRMTSQEWTVDTHGLSSGLYLITFSVDGKSVVNKFIKE